MVAEEQDLLAGALPDAAYRALVEAAPDIVAVFHGDGRIRYVNAAATALLGYAREEVVGRPIQGFFHADDRERAASRFAEVRDTPGSGARPAVYRVRCRDGSYRHLETLSLNRVGDAAIDGIFLIARDVTQRRQAETDRLAVQERRRMAAEVARLGIWEWNLATNELDADEAVRQLARTRPGQSWSGPEEFLLRFQPEDRERLANAIRIAATGTEVCREIARMPLPDGSLRWLYVYAQRLPDEDCSGPWLVGLVMDVTAQKLAEQELSRRGELLELATWGADLGIWTWYPGEDRAVIDERSIKLLGLAGTHTERPTAECNSRVHPDDLAELERLEQELVSGRRERFDYAYRVRRGDGDWHWLLDRGRISERDAGGRAVRVSGITLDIDEEKRKERELEEKSLRLDLALRASRLGLWDFDAGAKALYVDSRYTEITQITQEDVRRNHAALVDAVHEEDRQVLVDAIGDILSGKHESISFEGRLLGQDGRLTWICIEGFAASSGPDGLPARLIGTVADVTDRRRIEQLTRVGERVAGTGSYEFDTGADRILWSPGTYRVFELPEDFVPVRGTIDELLLPASRRTLQEALQALREEGRAFDVEVEARTARGRRIWVRIMARVESFGSRPVRYYGIVQDITHRKELEAALLDISSREQQRLGRELHDGLGQELTGISLLLQGVASQAKTANPALAPLFDRLGSLLSTAIRNTRLLAHGLAPVSQSRGGLEGALMVLAEQCSSSYDVPVSLQLSLEEPLSLDERAGNDLYRIAQEALNNAVRHGRASAVTIRLATKQHGVELEIVDDGRGISDEAFEAGGMGLRSMNYRAQGLQGTLEVTRLEQGGTRIRVSVPLPAG